MKGKATLILSDAKTGEVIRRAEEHNLVTNAITNIFDPPHYMLLHSMDYSKLFTTGLPLWKDLMGGVMLLGNNVPEDADSFMLGTGTVPIATAGDEYAGSLASRGSLNLDESYATENGYRFTWDFGTDKANGTIKCIGLTSKEFGNTGFCSQSKDYGSFVVIPYNVGVTGVHADDAFEYGLGQYIGTFEPFTHLFAELVSGGDLVLRRYRSVDPASIYINSATGLSDVSVPVSEKTVTPPVSIPYDHNYFLNTDDMTIQFFSSTQMNSDSTMTISYAVLDIGSLSFIKSGSFTVPRFTFSMLAVWKDRLYISYEDGIRCYGTDGALVSEVFSENIYATHFFVYNGCLMADYGQHVVCLSWEGAPHNMYLNSYIYPAYSVDTKAPYITGARRLTHGSTTGGSVKTKAMFYIVSSYMATINNLAQPIEKTSAHTLKVIYEITN